jgi:hypothetical protein
LAKKRADKGAHKATLNILEEARQLKQQAQEGASTKKRADEEAHKAALKWKCQPLFVYSAKDPDLPTTNPASQRNPHGIWKLSPVDGNDCTDEDCWTLQDIGAMPQEKNHLVLIQQMRICHPRC